ncbi:MAG TPA: nucleotidyltransferase domain-containing protein [Candidatus Wallbacteria bacterium]|nr:MAG: Nucleotidyltransferase domain protein [bacterium ADurb.Bin243]HOD42411.1 nucleotidyltransferase domain-containing protein [Candidatus Wallbacteria bacterium]HPG59119.1 nucleotidyltransferase domain-containing protein [Candidatus Wallbacteria bacterium]
MLKSTDYGIIKELVIKEIPAAVGLILFGSHSRGEARSDSDIDLMVLLEKELNWRERHKILNRIYRGSVDKGYNIDFVFKLKEKYESDKNLPTLSRVIAREGNVIWMKN